MYKSYILIFFSVLFFSCTEEPDCNCGEVYSFDETPEWLTESIVGGGAPWTLWYKYMSVENYCTGNVSVVDSVCKVVMQGDTVYIFNPDFDNYFDDLQTGQEWCGNNVW